MEKYWYVVLDLFFDKFIISERPWIYFAITRELTINITLMNVFALFYYHNEFACFLYNNTKFTLKKF